MPEEQAAAKIRDYIRVNFLAGNPEGELEDTSPLLERGVLNFRDTIRLRRVHPG